MGREVSRIELPRENFTLWEFARILLRTPFPLNLSLPIQFYVWRCSGEIFSGLRLFEGFFSGRKFLREKSFVGEFCGRSSPWVNFPQEHLSTGMRGFPEKGFPSHGGGFPA